MRDGGMTFPRDPRASLAFPLWDCGANHPSNNTRQTGTLAQYLAWCVPTGGVVQFIVVEIAERVLNMSHADERL